jgi:glutamine amidotransferase
MVVIIDYHVGNPASIKNMIKKIGYNSEISCDEELIFKSDKIILPGVGRFDYGMNKLNELNLTGILYDKVHKEKVPILGICLGFQLMTQRSEEGSEPGFGWLAGDTLKFVKNEADFKIPHMGWNTVEYSADNSLFRDFSGEARFYFVHSYYVKAEKNTEEIGRTSYFIEFSSAMQHDNIFGVQFHPEKSHKYGMQLISNFIKL